MNKNQIIVIFLGSIVLGAIAVKDLFLGGMRVSPPIIWHPGHLWLFVFYLCAVINRFHIRGCAFRRKLAFWRVAL